MPPSSGMDLKFALRSLRKNAGFTLLAVLIMALGIGANTAVFSVVNAVLLRPLAYRDPDRIVTLSTYWKKSGSISRNVSAPDFHDWHAQSTAFEAMAYYADRKWPVRIGSNAEYADVTTVTPDFLQVFGVEPMLGRWFSPEEEKKGGGSAIVISHAFWQSHFGGSSNVLGKTVRIFDKSLAIAGVLPPKFQFPGRTDVWFPADTIIPETTSRSGHNYRVVGRLKPDVSVEQAHAQMVSIAGRLEQQYPPSNEGKSVAVARLRDTMVSNIRLTLYLLLGAVGAVLLIACANMANLLVARASSRTREIAIRAAVGASRTRIIRQLITESLVLALVAGSAGLTLAVWGAEALKALAPGNVPRLPETGIDGWVLVFTLGISVASSLLFGLAPAVHASRVDLNDSLKQGAAKGVLGGGSGRLRGALVIVEIALSVVLLTGAGLLIRSFQALSNVELGFKPEKILIANASVPAFGGEGGRRATQFYKSLLSDLATLPGVSAVGASVALPGVIRSNGAYWIDHLPPLDQLSVTAPQAVFTVVAPGTFATLGIALKSGRDFTGSDQYEAPYTAVINTALAHRSFPGQDPIGRLIFCGLDSFKPMKIAGVVGDVRQGGPASTPLPEIYMPYEQHPLVAKAMSVLIRTTAEPGALSDAVRRKIGEHSPDVPVTFTTMQAALAENVAAPRFRTLLLGVFAALAVCLAMAGVYGVMTYMVSQRSSEIGLRMALGASSGDVLRMVLGQGIALTAAGLALGLAGAVAAAHWLTSMLFEIKATDPLTYAGVAALLAIVALAACYIPARTATQVDPLVALRQE